MFAGGNDQEGEKTGCSLTGHKRHLLTFKFLKGLEGGHNFLAKMIFVLGVVFRGCVCFAVSSFVVGRLFLPGADYMAYFRVHSRAKSVYFSLSVLNILAISGTKGSSGLGSHKREQIDNSTFEIVSAGDHWDLRMSKQMLPLELMLGW